MMIANYSADCGDEGWNSIVFSGNYYDAESWFVAVLCVEYWMKTFGL